MLQAQFPTQTLPGAMPRADRLLPLWGVQGPADTTGEDREHDIRIYIADRLLPLWGVPSPADTTGEDREHDIDIS